MAPAWAQEEDAPLQPDRQAETATGSADIPLDPITVFSDRQGSSVHDVPAAITVIDGEEIEARGLSDMQEIVRYLPGVTVQRQTTSTDPFSTFGGFTIRGVGGNRVQMLVDGSRVAERITDGTRDYLDFNFTKQVDVVKGPASVLWGADALGGIVAIETIDPEDVLNGRDRGGIGRLSYDSLNNGSGASAAYAQRLSDRFTFMLGVAQDDASETELSNARDDGGIYGCPRNVSYGATPCGHLNPMDVSSNRLLAKGVWTPSDRQRFEFSIDHLQRDTAVQYNTSLGPVVSSFTGLPTGEVIRDDDRDLALKRTRYALEHVWTPDSGFVQELKTTLAYTPHSYDRSGSKWTTSAAGDDINTLDYLSYAEDFLELDIQATSHFRLGASGHEVTWGFDGDHTTADYRRRTVTRNLTAGTEIETRATGFNFANADTRRADIYIQDKISLLGGALELTPGLRYATYKIDPRPDADYQTVPGSEPVVREDEDLLTSFGLLYRMANGWSAWGHYGEGFKMPTAQQLYTSLPGASFDLIPAPDLLPEKVKSYEIGVRRETAAAAYGMTAFYADYTDFIQSFYNPPGTTDYTYRNLAEVQVWGIELEGVWVMTDQLRLTGAASWQKGHQRASAGAARTPHTLPPLTATLGLTYDIPQYDLSLDVVGTLAAAVTDTENATDFKPAGYGLIDLYAKWGLTEGTALNVGVRNLLDKRYFEASAATYSSTASTSVAAANPIELQTGPGRVFTVSLDMTF